jgi:hypothetical protein
MTKDVNKFLQQRAVVDKNQNFNILFICVIFVFKSIMIR